jgi:hypothetical protein
MHHTSTDDGAKRVVFSCDFPFVELQPCVLLSSCNLACASASRVWHGQSSPNTWYRIILLLKWLLQLPPLRFPPLHGKMERKESSFHVIPFCQAAILPCAYASRVWHGQSSPNTWYRIILLLKWLLQLPPLRFPPLHGKMERKESSFHVIPFCQAAILPCAYASRVWHGQSCSTHSIASLCCWTFCSNSHQRQMYHTSTDGAKRVVLLRDFLCQAAIFRVSNVSRVWQEESCPTHGITSTCCWNGCSNSHQRQIRQTSTDGAKRVVLPRDFLCQAAIFRVSDVSRV